MWEPMGKTLVPRRQRLSPPPMKPLMCRACAQIGGNGAGGGGPWRAAPGKARPQSLDASTSRPPLLPPLSLSPSLTLHQVARRGRRHSQQGQQEGGLGEGHGGAGGAGGRGGRGVELVGVWVDPSPEADVLPPLPPSGSSSRVAMRGVNGGSAGWMGANRRAGQPTRCSFPFASGRPIAGRGRQLLAGRSGPNERETHLESVEGGGRGGRPRGRRREEGRAGSVRAKRESEEHKK